MTSTEQSLLRQFRMMLSDQRKAFNIKTDQLLASLDDMELMSIKEGDVAKQPLYTMLTPTEVPNGRKVDI